MNKVKNDRFISFEGIDYSGKSTQIALLKEFLKKKGFHVYVLREPGGTVISEKIRSILLDRRHFNITERSEIFLYSAARAQLVYEKIMPLLNKGYFIIADRYVDSTTAYQGYGRGIDPQAVRLINNMATLDLLPKVTFLMDISPETSVKRHLASGRPLDRLEATGDDFFRRIYAGYHKIAEKEKDRFIIIDARETIENIHQQIIRVVLTKIIGRQDEQNI